MGQRKPTNDREAEKQLITSEMERYRLRIFRANDAAADENYDVLYYRLQVRIDTAPNMLSGMVTFRAASAIDGLGSIRIDLSDSMAVDSIVSGSIPLLYTRTSSIITVYLGRTYSSGEVFTFDVVYHGVPASTGFGSFVFSASGGQPWIWSLSQPYGAKDWWPCKDQLKDKADSVDIVVTCDSSWLVGSNGALASIVNNGNGTSTTTWQERYPIATYLVSVAISNYAQFSNWWRYSPTDSMEVLNYVRPSRLAAAMADLPRTVDMLGIFSDMFGMYPFVNEKYGHSEFGWGGAMEHQTMTSTTTFSENLIAHELAHQWFGDMITCGSWADLWLNEGFATYCTGLYLEKMYGTMPFWNYMTVHLNAAKYAAGTLYVQDTLNVGNLFAGARVYSKGASVLHMLRHVLTDSVFFASMKYYADDPSVKHGTAVTADFRRACEAVSGRDLGWFFGEWVYGEKYPAYSYGWRAEPAMIGYRIDLRVVQTTGTTNPVSFTMPVDVRVAGAGWDTVFVVIDSLNIQDFTFNTLLPPTSVMVDSGRWLLRDLDSTSYVLLDVPPPGATVPFSPFLLENYPNPFNPATTITYGLSVRSRVELSVYSILGDEVGRLASGVKDPGSYRVSWDASGKAGGVYLLKLLVEPIGPGSGPPSGLSKKMLYIR
ncbi:MAG TPA: M1 family aminopeptidase [Bacteroidota bacterium]|nr:M1 family aminopeptidase [Bacteroidota bacterium]